MKIPPAIRVDTIIAIITLVLLAVWLLFFEIQNGRI